jgi:hypothetical protein
MASDKNGTVLRYMDAVAVPDFILNGERRAYTQGRYICQMFRGPYKDRLKIEINQTEVHLLPEQVILWSNFEVPGSPGAEGEDAT